MQLPLPTPMNASLANASLGTGTHVQHVQGLQSAWAARLPIVCVARVGGVLSSHGAHEVGKGAGFWQLRKATHLLHKLLVGVGTWRRRLLNACTGSGMFLLLPCLRYN
jgi:hypothetical protein